MTSDPSLNQRTKVHYKVHNISILLVGVPKLVTGIVLWDLWGSLQGRLPHSLPGAIGAFYVHGFYVHVPMISHMIPIRFLRFSQQFGHVKFLSDGIPSLRRQLHFHPLRITGGQSSRLTPPWSASGAPTISLQEHTNVAP